MPVGPAARLSELKATGFVAAVGVTTELSATPSIGPVRDNG